MATSSVNPLTSHLSDQINLLTSENERLRLSSESDQRRELAKQLAVSMKQRDSLRDKVVKVMAQNRKLLSGYRSLMAKVKERQERLMEAEQHYQESRFQHR